jgi:tripartite-type tricarboxylate transporter receptor subunit TctC
MILIFGGVAMLHYLLIIRLFNIFFIIFFCFITYSSVVFATAYPIRPIRLMLGAATGSGSDVVARVIATRLSENIGQQIVVDNRGGAAGLIAAELVAVAAPDGYTIWMPTLTQHLSTTMHKKYLLEKEFEPVGLVASTPFMLVSSSTIPAKTTSEFIAYAKARPEKLLFGSSGIAGSLHICVEVFQSMAGIKMVHVPYKGSAAAITDLMTVQIQLSCPPVAAMVQFMKNDNLRVLGVTSKDPTALAPGQPTIAQSLPGYAFPGWYGVVTPLKTPKAIVMRLYKEFARTVNAQDMHDRLIKVGVEPSMSTPEEFRIFLNRESERMGKLLRDIDVEKNK